MMGESAQQNTVVSGARWRELVALAWQAKAAGTTHWQFTVGDAALQLVPIQPRSGPGAPGVRSRLVRFARHLSITTASLQQYRWTAAAWPPEYRHPGVSYTIHQILVVLSERFERIHHPPWCSRTQDYRWTCDAARAVVAGRSVTPLDPNSSAAH